MKLIFFLLQSISIKTIQIKLYLLFSSSVFVQFWDWSLFRKDFNWISVSICHKSLSFIFFHISPKFDWNRTPFNSNVRIQNMRV